MLFLELKGFFPIMGLSFEIFKNTILDLDLNHTKMVSDLSVIKIDGYYFKELKNYPRT